ncbi:long-chain fatty acid--CoA ligase [Oryzobacter terrae]|uniref:AMP-binding enzyme n=1 Tax=Oryzobacter terrae TaxID=1620385 RepID=UPI003671A7D5
MTVVIDPFALADPVQAVLAAHDSRQRIALSTSGTTTSPRTLVRTTDSWWRSFDAYGRLTGVARGGRLWVPGPLTATMNLFAAVHATVVGAQIVGTPGEATDACLTPAQLDRLGHLLRDDARICVAGARLPERLVSERVVCYYGAAELSFVAGGGGREGLRPFEGVEVDLRDGEIWVRSEYLCDGYAQGGSGPLRVDPSGYATVGDLGEWRGATLFVIGRPEYITTAGATVSVAQIEAHLSRYARAPFAVYADPHPTLGEVVAVAVVEPRDADSLARGARTLPTSMRPRRVVVVAELPMTAAGKVSRAALAGAQHA